MAEIRKGKKVDPAKMDRAKMGVAFIQPPEEKGDASGQHIEYSMVSCPCYGHITYAYIDTHYWSWYTCGVCGCPFEA